MKVPGKLRKLLGSRKPKKGFATMSTQTDQFNDVANVLASQLADIKVYNSILLKEMNGKEEELDSLNRQIDDIEMKLKVNGRIMKKLASKKSEEAKLVEGNKNTSVKVAPPECGICNEKYTRENVPRVLDCGHTLCQSCVTNSIAIQGGLKCPWDRSEPSSQKPPLNMALLDVIRNVNLAKRTRK